MVLIVVSLIFFLSFSSAPSLFLALPLVLVFSTARKLGVSIPLQSSPLQQQQSFDEQQQLFQQAPAAFGNVGIDTAFENIAAAPLHENVMPVVGSGVSDDASMMNAWNAQLLGTNIGSNFAATAPAVPTTSSLVRLGLTSPTTFRVKLLQPCMQSLQTDTMNVNVAAPPVCMNVANAARLLVRTPVASQIFGAGVENIAF